ncbi:MAG: SusC/RagA family TonB-linked outer membrane protein [Bacteroidetes bacterium]|nr:SusC/RagA family TonB-linked outer membrane protein [Bacteroidota bacterium]
MPKKTKGLAKFTSLLILFLFLLCTGSAQAQNAVSGKIINKADNQPVPGATIQVKGTKVLAQSGADGAFTITLSGGSGTLVISAVGFQRMELPATAGTPLGDIAMATAPNTLNDVVVTGYTTQRRKDITGSVSVVNVQDMKAVPSGSTESLLQGQASGVTVVNTGQPGGYSNVHIRGITSFGNTDPLVIIDGTPGSIHDINPNDIASFQVLKDAGSASIYGVRGSNGVIIITTKRGRTGKVQVTYDGYVGTQRPLKKGWGLANPTEAANAIWQGFFNDNAAPTSKQYGSGPTPVIPDYLIPTGAKAGAPNTDPSTYRLFTNQITMANKAGTDWYHEIFHPVTVTGHNISASGGSDRSVYFYSFNYADQPGTLIFTSLKRYSARINSTFSFLDNKVRVGENIFLVYKSNPGYTGLAGVNNANSIGASYQIPTIVPVHDIKGNFAGGLGGGLGNAPNPVAIMERQKYNTNNDYNASGNVFAEVDFLKHFTARTQVGGMVDNYYYNSFLYTNYENAENNTNANSYQETNGWNTSLTWTSTLKYSNTFAENHNVTALIGTEYISRQGRALRASRGSYYITDSTTLTVDPNLWTLNSGSANSQSNSNPTVLVDNVSTPTPYNSSVYSLFGQLSYNYDDRYLINGTIRRDGASVFNSTKRYGIFPAVSAAWRISNEKFMKDVSWFSDLKIRGGWGKMGSISNITPTNPYSLYGTAAGQATYDINGSGTPSSGIVNLQYGNPATTWENDQLTNIGVDATFLNNHFDVSIEWYNKQISGLLNQARAAGTAGVGNAFFAGPQLPFINAGNITNHGIDVSVTYHGAALGNQLKFDLTGTFTSYVNEVKSLPAGIKYISILNGGTEQSRLQPGQAVGAFYGYKIVGLFQNWKEANASNQLAAAPGRFKYADVTRDGKITPDDRTFFGNPNPKFTAGLNVAVSYKGFDLFMLLYTSVGNKVLNAVKGSTDFPQLFGNAISKRIVYESAKIVNAAGQPTFINDSSAHVANPGTLVPALESGANFSNGQQFSSYTMESGSFLRCRTLTLGYTLDNPFLRNLHLDRLRVYAQVLNPFTITGYSGQDPEVLGSNTLFGIDGGAYPNNQKQYTIGVSLNIH